ncbi:deoxyribodipyrimidine photo-lyase [Ferrimonas sediminicola]|uniref:Deoxyribodipyrimidine photo-lyase n=1 Tax=Ferrimonas sediminicola TaxID=2569538 RepID=A0A4V5NVH6_9GAMM|nr:deoxyribodipyrimidine photo-lyase [Ferrimonas sediminicola]TKB50593.1 deoxyribodipyrimidine photo-lyase [Ferrimonas sediminicola]
MADLIWFRKDLRVEDHPALTQACCGAAPPEALYISTPRQWQDHAMAPIQADLLERAVNTLAEQLAVLGIRLHHLPLQEFSQVPQALHAFCRRHGIHRIHASEEPELNERRRDQQVIESGLELHLYPGHCILPPGSVVKGDGSPYRVFTPFRRAWMAQLRSVDLTPLPAPTGWQPLTKPAAIRLDTPKHSSELWPVGPGNAHQVLNRFVQQRMAHYQLNRDRPALEATSTLSPYLALGLISPRACLHAARGQDPEALEERPGGAFSWINELAWRDFYRHLLVQWPKLSKGKNFNSLADKVQWESGDDNFDAWCQGRTGFPLVDAAMRQLSQTGWMHNRLRMVAASFLTKNLLIDWRRGEHWFSQRLVDGDLAANNGGWQWSASTGCDAQPYFRIFNPVSQSKKFDPDGAFIRRYLPELAHLSDKAIHLPPESLRPADYPPPLVDLADSRRRALDRFSVMKREDY